MANQWKYIESKAELQDVIEYCHKTQYCSFDFETSGKYHDSSAFPTIVGISFQPGSSYILPLGHKESPFRKHFKDLLTHFAKEVLHDLDITKIAWNISYEHKWLMKYGLDIKGRWFDGMLAKHLLDEERPHSLESQVRRFFAEHDGYKDDTETLAKKFGGWGDIPMIDLAKRCALDCDLTFRLMLRFEEKLQKGGFYNLFRSLIMPMERVLAESEFNGFPIDVEYLERNVDKYSKLIAENELALRGLKSVRRYEKYRKKQAIREEIEQIQQEIEDIRNGESKNPERLIKARETKITNILQGNPTNKKQRALFEPLNFASNKQMVDFFYESPKGLKLPIIKRSDAGNPSTDEDTIVELSKKKPNPFIQGLLKSRELEKLNSTYIEGIKRVMSEDNRVHTSYLIHGTVTGRLSSKEPNMQNVPRVTTNPDIKPMFIPPPGMLLMEVDYSQAELRVVAELANEKVMLQWFRDKKNIHVATACKSVGKEHEYDRVKKILDEADAMTIEQITADPEVLFWVKQKKKAKTFNFGILYEQSDKMLAEGMGASEEEAKQFKKEWFATFPAIKRFMDSQHRFVRENAYVATMFGQKRRLPDIDDKDKWIALRAERQSVNTPIQGTAAQFCNFAGIAIREARLKGELPGLSIQMGTTHDSLLYAIEPQHIHTVVPRVVELCKKPNTLKYFGFELKKVDMKVSPEIGTHWGNLKDYSPTEDYTKWLK